MDIYKILETLKQFEEGSAQIGDRVQCPNDITGTIIADAGSYWIIRDDHAETEDDTLEFRKSDCTPIAIAEGQMKHYMWDMAERLSLAQFLEMFPDSEDFYLGVHGVDSREELDQNDWERDHPEIYDVDEATKFTFTGTKVRQRPGDQVRGTELARKKKSGEHPFKGRLVGASESVTEDIDPIIVRALEKMPRGLKGKGLPGDAVFDAARKALAMEYGLMKMRYDSEVSSNYTRQLIDLYQRQAAVDKKGSYPGVDEEKQRLVGALQSKIPMVKSFKDYLEEYGMTTGGTVQAGGGTGTDKAAQAKQATQVQQGINKLKSAGANIPNVQQAVKSTLKDPAKDPVSAVDRQVSAGLGQEVEQLLTKGDASTINQLTALLKKVKQGGATQ